MLLRRDLLLATTAAIILHGCVAVLSLQAPSLFRPISRVSDAEQTSPKPWNFSMANTTTSASDSPTDDFLAASASNTGADDPKPLPAYQPSKPPLEKVLSSTFTNGFSNSEYLAYEETDTPSSPAVNWILPLKKGYLNEISSIVVRVWIQQNGSIAGVELLDVRPGLLNDSQLQEVVDWLASTPMSPAMKNGENVASKRTVEIAFEH